MPAAVITFRRDFKFDLVPDRLWERIEEFDQFEHWWPWLTDLRIEGSGLSTGTVLYGVVTPPLPYRMKLRIEIVEAVRAIAEKVKSGKLESADITEKIISENLWTRGIPDPDLLIRTSGEMRVSNFLLWQISYAELVVTPTLWPDFRKPHFFAALEEYAKRHRRFGGV